MNLYLAAVHSQKMRGNGSMRNRLTQTEKDTVDRIPHLLESYHYIGKGLETSRIREDGKPIFLDSGAFSAFTQGVNVDLKTYCRYVKDNADIIINDDGQLLASVLDHIGSARGTYENQCAMEAEGVRPLPCFHYGEDERYLEYYVANYPYITLGGMVPISTPQLKLWLDRVWDTYLTDGAGNPRTKVHGFGLTTLSLMERYPWYSVDSSTWVQAGSRGVVITPRYGSVPVSEHNPSRKIHGQHLDSMPARQRDVIIKELTDAGFTIDDLHTKWWTPRIVNIWAFEQIGKDPKYNNTTFHLDQPGLF